MEKAIAWGDHALAFTPKMTALIHGYISERMRDRFSILFPASYVVQVFGDKIKLSCITVVRQEYHHICLILNPSYKPDEVTAGVNNTTYRKVTPNPMQFGSAFHRILQ